MIRRQYFTAILLLITSINSYAQYEEREGETRVDTIITLLNEFADSSSVILFENTNYIVKTSLSIFENSLNEWLNANPELDIDKNLFDLVLEDAKNNKAVDAMQIALNNDLYFRLEYRIADLLENGQCIIIHKQDNKIVSTIRMQKYEYVCGMLCGDAGRRFFIMNNFLIKVSDHVF
jgi:hypothetical protein